MAKAWQHPTDAPQRLRGRRGQQRRQWWLRNNPLCKHCAERGVVRLGRIVDHIIPLSKGGLDDPSNLQSLCKDCDEAKTAEDLGRTIKQAIGLDGYPVDASQRIHHQRHNASVDAPTAGPAAVPPGVKTAGGRSESG